MTLPLSTPIKITEKFRLPNDLVMLDAEMTGLNREEDKVLQIAMLKLKRHGTTYSVEDSFNEFIYHNSYPKTAFQKKYQTHIFQHCKKVCPKASGPLEVKKRINKWLGPLRGEVLVTGDCVPTDIDFLARNKFIDLSYFLEDGTPIEGTFHYEYFEMHPLKMLAFQKVGYQFEALTTNKEGIHDALVDCSNQLIELNTFLEILLRE